MTLTPLETLTYDATSLAEDTTPAWDTFAGYAIGTTRQLNQKLYKTLLAIDPLCHYVHDNSDPLNPHYTYFADTGVEVVDNTAVACTLNETIVYNKDTDKYYIFDNSTGTTLIGGTTYAVDFTTQDPTTPPNFTEVFNYRYQPFNPETTPSRWEDLGYTNKYKCLDQSLSSQTTSATDITMSFTATKIDEVHFLNVYASSIRVVVNTTDPTPVLILDETKNLYDKNGGTFYNYFFNDFIYGRNVTFEVPIAFEVTVDITITALDGAKVGLVGIGRSNQIGSTLYGASLGMIDFSKKLTNPATGDNYLEQGNYKATNNLTVDVLSGLTDSVYNLLTEHRANPVIFRSVGYQTLTIFGIYNNFDFIISTPTISKLSIDLESLI